MVYRGDLNNTELGKSYTSVGKSLFELSRHNKKRETGGNVL